MIFPFHLFFTANLRLVVTQFAQVFLLTTALHYSHCYQVTSDVIVFWKYNIH